MKSIIMPGEHDAWLGHDAAPCVVTAADNRRLSDWALIYVDINPNVSAGLAATDEDLGKFICGMTLAGSVFKALAREMIDADKYGRLCEVHPTRFIIDAAPVLDLAQQRGDGGNAINALLTESEEQDDQVCVAVEHPIGRRGGRTEIETAVKRSVDAQRAAGGTPNMTTTVAAVLSEYPDAGRDRI